MTNNVKLTFCVGDTTPRFTIGIELSKIIRIGDTKFHIYNALNPPPAYSHTHTHTHTHTHKVPLLGCKSVLFYYYRAHMANTHTIVSSHVPIMCNFQGNKIALSFTYSKSLVLLE
jgi:hypothetical protein